MKTISQDKIQKINRLLKPLMWDYSVSPQVWFDFIVSGIPAGTMPLSYDASLIRILERMAWYDLISLFGLETVKEKLTKAIIARLRDPLLKEHYEFARQLLHKEPLSASGWRPEYRKKIRATLLSNRWYRPESRVF